MSADVLITTLDKLLKLHQSLYELAVRKTDIIKNGDMDALNQILKDEQTHIAAIEQMEKGRQKAAKAIAPEVEHPVILDCIKHLDEPEQNHLVKLADELVKVVHQLKEQNHLNQQLVHHSLKFVHLSMDLLRPQPTEINYGPPSKSKQSSEASPLGMFNSKA